jgi:hypothetical protein
MDLRYEIEMATKRSPLLLSLAWRLRKQLGAMRLMGPNFQKRRVIEPGYDILIDGYPRSANTFACDAFAVAQGYEIAEASIKGYPIKMGNHMHAPAQFLLARRYRVPAMLVLREPVAAALSWVVYTHEKDAAGAWMHGHEGREAARTALRNYIRFHKPLTGIQEAFAIAPFEEITTDFGKSIARLNDKFGTDFALFDHTREAQDRIFEVMQARIKERESRFGVDLTRTFHFPQQKKHEIRQHFAAEFETADIAPLKEAATALYNELMAEL